MSRQRRALRLTMTALLAVGAAACSAGADPPRNESDRVGTVVPPSASPPSVASATGLPSSMAALGDSITRAFAACPGAGDCPAGSWSTGTAVGLNSHAQRIRRLSGNLPEVHNLAVSGATVAGLADQVDAAIAAKVDYVTVLIGANDACTGSETAMTETADFSRAFEAALSALVDGLPTSRVLVASIPDLQRLWLVGRGSDEVVGIWEQFGICRSMLASARSGDSSSDIRRARVRARVAAYNAAMSRACAMHEQCRWDAEAVFDFDFSLDMVSRADFWHPSARGQRALAEVTWRAGFWP